MGHWRCCARCATSVYKRSFLAVAAHRRGFFKQTRLRRGQLHGRPCFRACVSVASSHLLRHGKSSVAFGPYRKTNPQTAEDHIGDPGRQQMSGCRNHQNYCDQQSHIGPLDGKFGGHDTCPIALAITRLVYAEAPFALPPSSSRSSVTWPLWICEIQLGALRPRPDSGHCPT